MNCKNCFLPVGKEAVCESCSSPLHKECAITDGGTFCDVCYTVRGETATTKITPEMPEAIRRSYIETYRACPYKFYLQVLQGKEAPPTSYTQVGIDLHDYFEEAQYGREDKESILRGMKEKFDAYSDDLFSSGFASDTRENLWQRTIDSVDTFFEIILPNLPAKPFATEETLQFSIGEDLPKVQITMDRIDEEGDDLVLHDWKTGGVMVGKKISSDLQAPLYIKAVQEHYKRTVKRFTFYYLQENKTRVFEHVHGEDYVCRVGKREYFINLQDALREVNTLFSRIKNGDFNIPRDTKKMYFTCKMCHFKQDGTCQGAENESWTQYNKKRMVEHETAN